MSKFLTSNLTTNLTSNEYLQELDPTSRPSSNLSPAKKESWEVDLTAEGEMLKKPVAPEFLAGNQELNFYRNAALAFFKASKDNPNEEEAHTQLEESLKLIEKFIELDTKKYKDGLDRKALLSMLESMEVQIKCISEVIANEIQEGERISSYPYYQRGAIYLKIGERDLAKSDFQKVKTISQNDGYEKWVSEMDVRLQEIEVEEVLEEQKKYQNAVHAVTSEPLPEKQYYDFYNEARNSFEAYRTNSNKIEGYFQLDESLKLMKKAIELNPNGHWQNFEMGNFFATSGQYTESIESFSKEIEINQSLAGQIMSHLKRGESYLQIGEKDLFKSDFQKVKALVHDGDAQIIKKLEQQHTGKDLERQIDVVLQGIEREEVVAVVGVNIPNTDPSVVSGAVLLNNSKRNTSARNLL